MKSNIISFILIAGSVGLLAATFFQRSNRQNKSIIPAQYVEQRLVSDFKGIIIGDSLYPYAMSKEMLIDKISF